jgi:FixJ family two-component response regulator
MIEALRSLNGEQLYVVAGIIAGATERQIAEELSASRQQTITRERVHRIKLTAYAKLRRVMSA